MWLLLITQVVVDKDDPAFQNPKKRIGKIYTKAEAGRLCKSIKAGFSRKK